MEDLTSTLTVPGELRPGIGGEGTFNINLWRWRVNTLVKLEIITSLVQIVSRLDSFNLHPACWSMLMLLGREEGGRRLATNLSPAALCDEL